MSIAPRSLIKLSALPLLGFALMPGNILADPNIIDDTVLPGVGELADRTMTRAEEARLKKLLRARLYGRLPIEEDPESNAYIQQLLHKILSGSDIEQDFDILIVRDPKVNAFAMPGGLLAFNTGLITQARNESELAGVVAHEVAHVTQRHIARMFDQMQHSNLNLLTTAGILLAGIYQLSALVPAAMIGQAAQIQEFLNHSRANEQEADRFATRMLAQAGIDPGGVARFFQILITRSSRTQSKDYEYLSTHPTSQSRIIEAQSRAQQYKGKFIRDTGTFHYIRQRLIALLTPPHVTLQRYQTRLSANDTISNAELYGIAVSMQRSGQDEQAIELLNGIETNALTLQRLITLARIRSLDNLERSEQALELLLPLYQQFPKNYAIERYLIELYLATDQPKEALKLARVRVRRGIQDPQTYRLLAEAGDATGQPIVTHLSLADHYIHRFQLQRASKQLDIAQKYSKANSVNEARITQRREEILRMTDAL